MVADFRCGRLVIRLPINIGADIRDGRGGGLVCKFRGSGGFVFGGFVDSLDELVGEDVFVEEAAFEHGNGVVVRLVVFDFLRRPVFLVIRIRDAVAVVAVGVDFEDGGFVFLACAIHGDVGFRADFVEV